MAGDVHDRLVAGPAFGELGDERVPVVVPAPRDLGLLAQILPSGLQSGDRPSRVVRPWLAEGEHVPLGPDLAKTLGVPF